MTVPSPFISALPSPVPDVALYSDPLYITRGASPYYRESHYRLQRELRAYVDTQFSPFCEEWETKGKIPDEVLIQHAKLGYAAVSVYPLATGYLGGQCLPANIKASEWDGFHDLIFIDETVRCGCLGVIWGLGCGNSIGAPPLVNYGSNVQRRKFLPDVLQGRSRFCLGITEPDGMLSSSVKGISAC
jgi:alkylation response protein AidB-like acyl-CoA dehydrogenase